MSGIKDENLRWFYRHIHRRGVDAGTLAEAIASGRTHVTEVLNGTTDSPRTRRRLAPLLRSRERELLGWDRHGNVLAPLPPAGGPVHIPNSHPLPRGETRASVPREPMSADRHLQEATA